MPSRGVTRRPCYSFFAGRTVFLRRIVRIVSRKVTKGGLRRLRRRGRRLCRSVLPRGCRGSCKGPTCTRGVLKRCKGMFAFLCARLRNAVTCTFRGGT